MGKSSFFSSKDTFNAERSTNSNTNRGRLEAHQEPKTTDEQQLARRAVQLKGGVVHVD